MKIMPVCKILAITKDEDYLENPAKHPTMAIQHQISAHYFLHFHGKIGSSISFGC
jgi:hypothetical protein